MQEKYQEINYEIAVPRSRQNNMGLQ